MPTTHPAGLEAALDALDAGDLETLEALLAADPGLARARVTSDEPPYDGYFSRATLLHHVAGNPIRGELPPNVVDVARALLDAGADVNATCGGGPAQPDTAGGTTLGLVASGVQAYLQGLTEPLIDCLLEAGADMDAGRSGGLMWLALYHTVENRGQREVAEMLYERGHEVDLCFAAGLGKLETVESYFLGDGHLAPGADRLYRHHRSGGASAQAPEIVQDALLFACINGRAEVAEYLLDQGADVNAAQAWGGELPTPLHGAAWAGWRDVAAFLVERGADVTARDRNHNSTPLGWAAYCQRHDVVDYFLDDGPQIDLLDALELGLPEHFESALGDADPDQPFGPGGRGVLLRAAASAGYVELVEILLERGADSLLTNPDGKTALDWAIEKEHPEIVELLRRAMTGL